MLPRYLRQAIKTSVRRRVPCRYVTWAGPADGNRLALTFDDGPHPEYTPQILAALGDVPATFFVVGSQVERYLAIVGKIIDGGHELGNHTYTHANLGNISWRRGWEELQAADRLLRRHDSRFRGLYRPPWGRIGLGGALFGLRTGYRAAMWSVDSGDYRRDGAQPLIERVKAARLQAGDVLLFHDDNEYTAEALPTILRILMDLGFSFATVSELLGRARLAPPSLASG